jgi:hypothetical protein
MWRCGRWRGGVRFWLLRFEVRTEGEKRGPLAERSQGSAKAHPLHLRRPFEPVIISLCLLIG